MKWLQKQVQIFSRANTLSTCLCVTCYSLVQLHLNNTCIGPAEANASILFSHSRACLAALHNLQQLPSNSITGSGPRVKLRSYLGFRDNLFVSRDLFPTCNTHHSTSRSTHSCRSSEMATNSIKLLTGNSHGQLAKLVADRYVRPHSGFHMGLARES